MKIFSRMLKKREIHTFVVLFFMTMLVCMLTYIIPAGSYSRTEDTTLGQTVVIPGTYEIVEQTAIAPWKVFHKFFEALCLPKTATLIFFVLIIGGSFEIVMATGCMVSLCESILKYFKHKKLWIIPVFVFLFSIFGFTMGLSTASVIFVPIGIAVAKSLDLDEMTGMAMVALGTNAGFTAGVFNPFSVGIAQKIAEVPLYSGAWLRWIVLIVLNLVTSLYLMFYAKKHKMKQTRFVNEEISEEQYSLKYDGLSKRNMLVLAEFVLTFIILTFGISKLKWEMENIAVTFLCMGIVSGLTAGYGINKTCNLFTDGCRKMMKGALVIGIAATMRLVLEEGNILDSITYELVSLVYFLPKPLQLIGIYLFNVFLEIFITSGSAKAVIVMPIMTPMADLLGFTRQSAVFAFQLGDGLPNLTSPVSTTLNGVLAVSGKTYESWVRFYFPLVAIYLVIGAGFVFFAQLIGY